MYARTVTVTYSLDKMDEAVQVYREAILPEMRQQTGFKGVMALIDRSTGKGISLTLWETEVDARASGAGSSYMQAGLAKLATLFTGAPTFDTYEVVVQE